MVKNCADACPAVKVFYDIQYPTVLIIDSRVEHNIAVNNNSLVFIVILAAVRVLAGQWAAAGQLATLKFRFDRKKRINEINIAAVCPKLAVLMGDVGVTPLVAKAQGSAPLVVVIPALAITASCC